MGLLETIRRVKASGTSPTAVPTPVTVAGQKVLLIYLFPALGDAVLVAPVAKSLLDAGAKKVGLVVRASAAKILKLVDLPLQLHILPDALALPPAKGPKSPWKKAELKKEAALFLQKLTTYSIRVELTHRADIDGRPWLAGAPARLGWLGPDETLAEAGLTHGTLDERWQAERHWTRYLVQPLGVAGIHKPSYPIAWKLSAANLAKVNKTQRQVILVPGARSPEKRWPAAHFLEVGKWAQAEAKSQVVVVGAPDEGELVKGLAKKIPGAQTYLGASLGPLLALIQTADAVVTNDTGPMHFAFLSGTPTVALFTEMSPVCWGPPGPDPRFVVLRPPSGAAGEAWSRAVIHYLDGLLARGHKK